MSDERSSSPIAQTVRDVPGIALASIGFGCALLAIEGDRLSTIQTVNISDQFHAFASLLSFVALVVLALLFRKKGFPDRTPTVLVIGVGAVMSASMLVLLQQGSWEESRLVSSAARAVFGLSEGLILFVWIKELFPYGARANAVVLALGTIVVAVINCLVALLKVDAANATVSILPLMSVVLLCYFREYARSRTHGVADGDGGSVEGGSKSLVEGVACPDRSLLVPSDFTARGRRVFAVTLALSLFCYAVVFGQIHYQWVGLQDGGTVSLIIQLGTAAGTACGGAAILALVQCFWSRRSFELYKVFLIPTVLLALWLSSFVNETWIFLYLALLNITQKLVFMYIALAPFLIMNEKRQLMPWCMAFLAFTAGKAASSFLLENMSADVFVASSVVALVVLFVCGTITSLSGSVSDYTSGDQRTRPVGRSGDGAVRTNKLQNACRTVAEKHQLTNREEEILLLLARGRTAQHIAETLVITQSTAKTHLRNIYAKMGVHTQQEIINLIEHAIDEQRREEDSAALHDQP